MTNAHTDTMTHDELAYDLAHHLSEKTGRIVWTDMQLGPVGSPRPDVYSIDPSFMRFRPLAYEVKVSKSDYRRDITSGKWQTYLPFAAGVIFAVPAGLVARSELPEGCGLMVRNADGWRTIKAPTLNPIKTLPHKVWVKLLIDGIKREAARQLAEKRPALADEWSMRYKIGKKLGNDVRNVLDDRATAEDRYRQETQRLRDVTRDVTESISKKIREHEQRIRQSMERDAAAIDAVRAELTQALGLPVNSSVNHIQIAAAEQVRRLSRDDEVWNLRRALSMAQRALSDGLSVPDLAAGGQT